jgi:hypothetical protein
MKKTQSNILLLALFAIVIIVGVIMQTDLTDSGVNLIAKEGGISDAENRLENEKLPILIGVLACIFTLTITAKPFFGKPENLKKAIFYRLKPDLLSALDGEYVKDIVSSTKLSIWTLVGFLVGLAARFVAASLI